MTRTIVRWATSCILGALLVSNCVAWHLLERRQRAEGTGLSMAPGGRALVEGPLDTAGPGAGTATDRESERPGQLEALGQVAELTDPRFDRESGSSGLWRPLDFLADVGRGTYFLEACDPIRTPVLFVHGITGGPRDFEAILASLDRSRFEPWLYYYPTGAPLDQVSDHLARQVAALRQRCRFGELFVVAHSMGGLVARSFILKQRVGRMRGDVTLFVSVATPWGGQAAARFARLAPAGLDLPPSFQDVAPESAFIEGLFFEQRRARRVRRHLPPEVSYHLVYGFKRAEGSSGPSADGVVPLSSGARLEAQEEARSQRALDYGHAEILRSRELIAHLGAILARAAR